MTEVLYENEDIVFCVKPAGMSSEEDLYTASSGYSRWRRYGVC